MTEEQRGLVRQLWKLLEPVAATIYFAPEATTAARELGYDPAGRGESYFAFRAAPLGRAGAELVTATFYGFSPRVVRRFVPGIWQTAAPDQVVDARYQAMDLALRALWPTAIGSEELAEAAQLARQAAEAANHAGRPLAAANADLAWPTQSHLVLWQAATIIREHRGDGHIAALLTHGLDPVESLVSFAAVGAAPVRVFASRGWSKAEWDAATERLAERGLVDAAGTATEAGHRLRDGVEALTDDLAAALWAELGARTKRLAQLVMPLMKSIVASGMLPNESTLGIHRSK
ncbi:MAG: SCO6745 family protein [Stackebrandtia sp.]